MDGAHRRQRGYFVVATLVALALSLALPAFGAISAPEATSGPVSAYEGSVDDGHQTTHKAKGIQRQARLAKTRTSVGAGCAAPVATAHLTPDQTASTPSPSAPRTNVGCRTADSALGRAPPV